MTEPEPQRSLGLPTPFGILENNVFIAGLEAAVWLHLLRVTVAGKPFLPTLPDQWKWWYAVAGFLGIIGLFILGLAVEGLAGLTERLITRRGAKLRVWYAKVTNHPPDWTHAQRWIWTSPQAAAEYGRRRLRILIARNTAFNVAILTVITVVHFLWRHQGASILYPVLTFLAGSLLTLLFAYVWIDAHRAYHRAIADAGEVDRKRAV